MHRKVWKEKLGIAHSVYFCLGSGKEMLEEELFAFLLYKLYCSNCLNWSFILFKCKFCCGKKISAKGYTEEVWKEVRHSARMSFSNLCFLHHVSGGSAKWQPQGARPSILASNTWSFTSCTGWAPLSPPPKTYSWFPMTAEDVWNVLGEGGGVVTSGVVQVLVSVPERREALKYPHWGASDLESGARRGRLPNPNPQMGQHRWRQWCHTKVKDG